LIVFFVDEDVAGFACEAGGVGWGERKGKGREVGEEERERKVSGLVGRD